MKIVYMIENIACYGGLQRIIVDKMNALVAKGMDVTLMTAWKGCDISVYDLDERVKRAPLNVYLPHQSMAYLLALPILLHCYNRKISEIRPDVVVHFRAVGAFLLTFGKKVCHTVFESHGVRSQHIHLWMFPPMERRVDTLVCLTEGDAKEYFRTKDVRVIPNFTDYKPKASIDYSKKHCVFANRLSAEKCPLRLLRMWKTVNTLHPDWVLDIYGTGELEEQMNTFIQDNGLGQSVIMHGYVTDTDSIYSSGSIFLLTSNDEGFSLSLLESMTIGLPTVSLDTKYGPQSLIVNGKTGYLTDFNNDDDFVARLSQLMDDTELRHNLGQEAKKRAKLYEKEVVIKNWITFFNSIKRN